MLTIAIAKGRIFDETLLLLKKSNIVIDEKTLNSRKLILETNHKDIEIMVVRASDVAVFVQHNVADLGIVGFDSLCEHANGGIYELLDLNIAKCRLCLAAKKDIDLNKTPLKIATKYQKMTEQYFQLKQKQVDIIKLYGSVELAASVNLADGIVDLVDSGATLKENNLIIVDTIMDISTRLIANSAAYKTKNSAIKQWLKIIEKQL